jgi:hypothetical protein
VLSVVACIANVCFSLKYININISKFNGYAFDESYNIFALKTPDQSFKRHYLHQLSKEIFQYLQANRIFQRENQQHSHQFYTYCFNEY